MSLAVPDEMISWAMRVCGETYFLSVVSDFAVEPQWRPRVERTCSAVHSRPGTAFRRTPRRQAGKSGLRKLMHGFVRRALAPSPIIPRLSKERGGLAGPRLPSLRLAISKRLSMRFAIWRMILLLIVCWRFPPSAFGFPDEATDDVVKVLGSIRAAAPNADNNGVVVALSVVAHIAILANHKDLADSV